MQAMMANARAYDWPTWFIGIMRAFISGGAGAIASPAGPMYLDPKDFNLGEGLGKVLISMAIGFLIMGIVTMGIFLKTHGAPDLLQASLQAASDNIAAAGTAVEAAKKES